MNSYYCKSLTSRTVVSGLICSSSLLCSLALAQRQDLNFTDVALAAGFQDRLSHGRALVAADFDGNGWTDFFIANPADVGDDSFIFWNDGPDQTGAIKYRKGQVLFTGERAFTASAADYDNDGDPDLFVGFSGQEGIGLDYLFRNDSGVFVDVSSTAGIQGPMDSTGHPVPVATSSGTWADYDKDGDLDLFVAARIIGKEEQEVMPGGVSISLILPNNLGWRDTLFQNNGDGTFTDVTEASGVAGIFSSMTASWGDYDNDGWVDLIIPQYIISTPFELPEDGYLLYRNDHDGTFSEITLDEIALGVGNSAFWATVTADFNNDGWLDILGIGNPGARTPNASHSLLINHGDWSFSNEAISSGLASPEVFPPRVMGCQVGDLDSDGYPDVLLNNGWPWGGEVDKLFLNTYTPKTGISFQDVSPLIDFPAESDPACTTPEICDTPFPYHSHAAVFVDYDRDGDVDIAKINGGTVMVPDPFSAEPNRLFRNDGSNANNWLFISLVGSVSNRDGVGARIEVTSSKKNDSIRKIYQEVKAGSCFSASGPEEIHIGLGRDEDVEQIRVSWPSGVETVLNDVDINQRIRIRERILSSSDFNDGVSRGWTPLSGAWSVSGGHYMHNGNALALSINTSARREDFSVVSKLTYLSGKKQMGLLGRVSRDGKDYYGAMLQDTKARIYKSVNGRVTPIGNPISIDAMTPGKSYVVRLTFEGKAIEMSVDGQRTPVIDKTIRSGVIGLISQSAAAIDYVVVHANSENDEMEDDKLENGKMEEDD